jgi:hypothetical protein
LAQAVESKKCEHCHTCRAFIAINKGVVLTQMKSICGSQMKNNRDSSGVLRKDRTVTVHHDDDSAERASQFSRELVDYISRVNVLKDLDERKKKICKLEIFATKIQEIAHKVDPNS